LFSRLQPAPPPRSYAKTAPCKVRVMKQMFPVVLALIPLAAVIGACVTCP
jgi:hypothetical protein